MGREAPEKRWRALQGLLQQEGYVAAILMSRTSIYYYAGTGQPCNLLLPAEGEPVLFVRRAEDFVRRETWIRDIRTGADFTPVVEEIKKLNRTSKVGIEEDILPVKLFRKLTGMLSHYELQDVSHLILEQRFIKSEEEIAYIRKAGAIFQQVHETIMDCLKPGITERELAGEIVKCVRKSGGEGVVFQRRWDAVLSPDGLVVAGTLNLTQISGHAMTVTGVGTGKIIPWGASDYVIQSGDLVVVDMAINYQGYHIDQARTYVAGKASNEQEVVFAKVKSIQEAVLSKVRPGTSAEELWVTAREKAKELGVDMYFQGYGTKQGQYIGHCTGLEFDEPPTLAPGVKKKLAPGVVICLEPKLIIPGWGSIDLEDTVLVTLTGYEFLCPVKRELFATGG